MPEITLLAAVSKKRFAAGSMSDTGTHATIHTNTEMGRKTSQCIYREEGSSIKRTSKIRVWLTVVIQSWICNYSQPWQTNTVKCWTDYW